MNAFKVTAKEPFEFRGRTLEPGQEITPGDGIGLTDLEFLEKRRHVKRVRTPKPKPAEAKTKKPAGKPDNKGGDQ